jgi:hypothetical protein
MHKVKITPRIGWKITYRNIIVMFRTRLKPLLVVKYFKKMSNATL